MPSNDNIRGKYFKESFKGFNKEDVISFIDRMNREHVALEEGFQKQIKALKEDIVKITAENGQFIRDIERNNQIILDLNAELNRKNENISSKADEQTAKSKETIKALEEAVQSLADENVVLREKVVLAAETNIAVSNEKSLREFINGAMKNLTSDENQKLRLKYIIKKIEEESGLKAADICPDAELDKIDFSLPETAIKREFDEEKAKEIYQPVIDTLASEKESLSKKTATLSEQCENLKKENAKLSEAVKNLEIKLENKQINVNFTGNLDEEVRVKAYETIMAGLGKIIFSTEKEAEDTILKANLEADDIIGKAEKNAEALITDTETKHRELLKANAGAIAKVRARYDRLMIEYSLFRDKLKNSYKDFTNGLDNFEIDLSGWENHLKE